MATALRLFIIICEEIRPVGVFNYTGTKLRQCCLVLKMYLFSCSWMRCIMYVLCTLPMYHLSTHDRNLYTFAQSTQCLYICSYFVTYDFFILNTCACVRFCQETMKKRHVLSDWFNVCLFAWVIWFYSSFFFSMREINLQAENCWAYCEVESKDGFILNHTLADNQIM